MIRWMRTNVATTENAFFVIAIFWMIVNRSWAIWRICPDYIRFADWDITGIIHFTGSGTISNMINNSTIEWTKHFSI